MVGEVVNLVNRTLRPLTVRFDGRTRVLQPGNNAITSEWVRYAKLQNPRMGSFAPGTLDGDYLCGVEGVDETDMIDEAENPSVERFDRRQEAALGNTVTVTGTGERDAKRMNTAEFSAPLPANVGFDKRA